MSTFSNFVDSVNSQCFQCPRHCGAERADENSLGFCGVPNAFRIAKISLHPFEEPCICGGKGAGTVFFCGCNLRCIFCQNRDISHGNILGTEMSPDALCRAISDLQSKGASCIDLVTPTHYTEQLIPVLRAVRKSLKIPVVWNSGGYESVDTLRKLEGLVDIYLPDCKYYSAGLSSALSGADDYFPVACSAIGEMLRQVGGATFSQDGSLLHGVLIRHLVLPSHRNDSIALLRALAEKFGPDAFLLSLMSQYTPEFAPAECEKSLHRRLTSFEYETVLEEADKLGFSGYSQRLSSASASYTPNWNR